MEKALEIVLDDSDIAPQNKPIAHENFMEAFEDDPSELARLVEVFPKLVQKWALQPQVRVIEVSVSRYKHCFGSYLKLYTTVGQRLWFCPSSVV